MSFSFGEINYLAVLTTAVVIFLLGGAWYTALFGKTWVKLHGYSDERIKQMKEKRPPALFFTGMIICYLLISLALAVLMTAFETDTVPDGLLLAVAVWVIVAGFRFTGWLAEDKPIGVFVIDASFDLVAVLLAGMVLAVW